MPNAFCLFCQVSFQMDEFPGPAPHVVSLTLACVEVVETHSWGQLVAGRADRFGLAPS